MTDIPARPRYWLHLLLFLATLGTTTSVGGFSYSIPLMAILLCHELGHYFVARWHGVPASLPYFIPLPILGMFGTMGAVISMPSVSDRKKLIDIGAAGPLAGLAVAVPVLIAGLMRSPVQATATGLQEGNSIFYLLLKYAIKGAWLPGHGLDVNLHPMALAGWAGLLVTMLNLLPVGQLDGGHVFAAYFGNGYARIARVVHVALPFLAVGVFAWVCVVTKEELAGVPLPAGVSVAKIALPTLFPWLIWFGVLGVIRRLGGGEYHPPVDETPLPRSRKVLFWAVAVIMVFIFMPVPMRPHVSPADLSSAAAGGFVSR